jgi:arsenite methyltransferase
MKHHAHDHGPRHDHHAFADADQAALLLDDPARDAWQRPDEVLRALALSPSMTVADVGAGTGYFAMRLARAVPQGQVVATDVEPAMVRHLAERARRERCANLRAVHATPAASGLDAASFDAILVVHAWHHVAHRAELARDVAAALKRGGRVVVVEFAPDAQRGPPIEMRLAPDQVIADLVGAGLDARVAAVALPEQYVVEAQRP